jgi:hypothetical protein
MSNTLSKLAFQALAGLVMFALVFGLGYQQGVAHQVAKDAKAVQQAQQAYQAERARGEQAAQAYTRDASALTSQFQTLTGQFHELSHRVPLVVHRPAVHAAGGRVPAVGAGQASPATTDDARDQPAQADVEGSAPDPWLSAAAVWMWNSALAGRDVPAGACGAADTSDTACAVDTGLPLAAAWDNHAVNAEISATNALRQQRLIDYLHDREKRKAHVGP